MLNFVLTMIVLNQQLLIANIAHPIVEKRIQGTTKRMQHYQHKPSFITKEESDWLYAKLLKDVPWRQVKYYKPERGLVVTPRLTWCCGFHQDEYYDIRLPQLVSPQEIPRWLQPLKSLVESELSTSFNFILFSYYRDGQDSIAFHSDDERFLGEEPTIASITVGAPRPFILKEKATKVSQTFSLDHGDLFVMQRNCQSDYLHSVPKMTKALPRISLTFRKALSEAGSKNYYKYNYLDKPI